jgi:hypothetical protein
MINKNKHIRAILVNDWMFRMISLNFVNKMNAHKVNKKISIFRIQNDYTSSWRRKNKERFLFLRKLFFYSYRI